MSSGIGEVVLTLRKEGDGHALVLHVGEEAEVIGVMEPWSTPDGYMQYRYQSKIGTSGTRESNRAALEAMVHELASVIATKILFADKIVKAQQGKE